MTREDRHTPTLAKLISVQGLAAMAVLGVSIVALSRLFSPENILREVLTEVVASLGSTILVVAVFGLFFRSGLEHLLRWAPDGESLAESANRLRAILQDLDQQDQQRMVSPSDEAKLDRIEEGVRSLAEDGIHPLKKEIEELRKLIADSK
jgi:hypothetical protein